MIDLDEGTIWIFRIVASLLCACFYFAATAKLVGAMQQSGYSSGKFFKWLKQERNTYLTRLLFLSVLAVSSTALVIFVFSFLQEYVALALGAIPFFGFTVIFYLADRKHALKVEAVKSGRWVRLAIVYFFLIAIVAFAMIYLCSLLYPVLSSLFIWLRSIRFLPLCFMPLLLPCILALANLITAPFETARNRKFVKRAGQVLNETNVIRVGVVGSYGKTSVKNILKELLSTRFNVVATPASYNTPMGVAKTVVKTDFTGVDVFVVEMGARNEGDISELCTLVRPDYIIFTGVCAQHVQTFGSLEGVFKAKCEALSSGAKLIVCGASLREDVQREYPNEAEKCLFVSDVKDLCLRADGTSFTLPLGEGDVAVKTCLLGEAAAENILLAATLAEKLGLSAENIVSGVAALKPIEHRLQLTQENGVYILDDAYNCNEKGAKIAIDALKRFSGKKYVVTPGIVETGVLHTQINGKLGGMLAEAQLDGVILVGETQAKVIVEGYKSAGGDDGCLQLVPSLDKAVELLKGKLVAGDCVLFMNDLPDVV